MFSTDDLTPLVCLFHSQDHAQVALEDLRKLGIPEQSISVLGRLEMELAYATLSVEELRVPERDRKRLMEGIKNGGAIVAVASTSAYVNKVENIFENHSARKIDEGASLPSGSAFDTIFPIVEEDFQVGKRTVERGGVRVYRRIIEIPVNTLVNLRDDHVTVERRPVDRFVTDCDLALQGSQTIELTETTEEVVLTKTARVVEEIVLGKSETIRTEHIIDTVRRTEVEVEEFAPQNTVEGGRGTGF